MSSSARRSRSSSWRRWQCRYGPVVALTPPDPHHRAFRRGPDGPAELAAVAPRGQDVHFGEKDGRAGRVQGRPQGQVTVREASGRCPGQDLRAHGAGQEIIRRRGRGLRGETGGRRARCAGRPRTVREAAGVDRQAPCSRRPVCPSFRLPPMQSRRLLREPAAHGQLLNPVIFLRDNWVCDDEVAPVERGHGDVAGSIHDCSRIGG